MFPHSTAKMLGWMMFSIFILALIIDSIFDISSIYEMDPIRNINTANFATLRHQHAHMLKVGSNPPFPDDSMSNIDWFVQVTDIHISVYRNYDIVPDFKSFIVDALPVIKPAVVMVTGDLTDAKSKSWYMSKQSKAEWVAYKSVIESTGIDKKLLWLDIRGNHDTFSVPNLESQKNYFKHFAVQGNKDKVFGITYTLANNQDTIEFIGVDASIIPGPMRPFNFFGILNKEVIADLDLKLKASINRTHTIVFGHYPTSIIHSPSRAVENVLGQASVYLCGHLHTIFGAIPHMFTRQASGYLELELGDWKLSRLYRIIAIDHGLLSFADQKFQQWPALLVTNPKNSLYNIAHRDPLNKILNSTHIRILCFTPEPPCSLDVSIDGKVIGRPFQVKPDQPLYVLKWHPLEFAYNGVHSLDVIAKDKKGDTNSAHEMFCVGFHCDLEFELISRFSLMLNFLLLIKFLFWVIFSISITILMACKLISIKFIRYKSIDILVIGTLYSYIHALARRPRIVNFLILYNFYLLLGPWFIGEMMDGYTGLCFLHGIFVEWQYIPGSLTYFLGGLHFAVYVIPLTFYLGSLCKRRICQSRIQMITLVWFFCWLIYQTLFSAYLTYGLKSALMSPAYLWSIPVLVALRHNSLSGVVRQRGDSLYDSIDSDDESSILPDT